MIIPWPLIGRLAVALLAAFAVLIATGARRERLNGAADLALTLVVGAAVGGRLLVLGLDTVLLGSLPDLRALLALGPGLSVPGALIGATAVGWRHRVRVDRRTWTDAGVAVAVALAAFSALHLPAVLAANSVLVVALLVAALGLHRSADQRWHPGLRLVTSIAAAHLAGAAFRPTLATVDADVDLALTITVLLVGLLTRPQVSVAVRRLAGVGAFLMGGLVVVAAMTPGDLPLAADDTATTASLDGAIRAGGESTDVPAWGAEELSALIGNVDVPIVVNLWASWCPPCHAEAATVARAAVALEGRAVVLGVLVDDQPGEGQAFADRYGLGFPTVVDAGLSDALGMAGLPTTVILSQDGTVIRRVVGGLAQTTLAEAVAEASRQPAGQGG